MARERDEDEVDGDEPLSRPSGERGPLDSMYANTNIIVLVLFGICCGAIAFILSLVAYLTAKDPKAKSNALIVLITGAVMTAVAVAANLMGGLLGR